MAAGPWHIVTGEYPPHSGGVSDYTRALAVALARAGEERVHVWAPAVRGVALAVDAGVTLHPLRGGFRPAGLAELSLGLSAEPRGRLLVQYVPHAYGMRGLNVPFAEWLAAWRRDSVRVMFHEVALVVDAGVPAKLRLAAAVTQYMARRLVDRADQIFVSTEAWAPLLERLSGRRVATACLPIPSNLPVRVDAQESARVRARVAPQGPLLGHFGTYGAHTADLVEEVTRRLARASSERTLLLLGRGGDRFVRDLLGSERLGALRVVAPGAQSREEIAVHLAACDLLLQPYPDGITTRRTTVMAGLALGVPVVSNRGQLSEPWWPAERAVGLSAEPEASGIAEVAESVLEDPAELADLGRRGKLLYDQRFSMQRTVSVLREACEDRR